jgi:hypothetical protein
MQNSKDTNESGWQTTTRRNKSNRKNNQSNNQSNNGKGTPGSGRRECDKKEDKWSQRPHRNQTGRNCGQSNFSNIKKSTEQKKYTQPPQPVYTGPDFASLIPKHDPTSNEDVSEYDYVDDYTKNPEYSSIVIPIITSRFRPSVRNQVPKPNTNNSYDTWEFIYFQHILELHDIFADAINELGISRIDTKSADFLHVFGKFIRECSSGKISPHVEDLTERQEHMYIEYTIKRNES